MSSVVFSPLRRARGLLKGRLGFAQSPVSPVSAVRERSSFGGTAFTILCALSSVFIFVISAVMNHMFANLDIESTAVDSARSAQRPLSKVDVFEAVTLVRSDVRFLWLMALENTGQHLSHSFLTELSEAKSKSKKKHSRSDSKTNTASHIYFMSQRTVFVDLIRLIFSNEFSDYYSPNCVLTPKSLNSNDSDNIASEHQSAIGNDVGAEKRRREIEWSAQNRTQIEKEKEMHRRLRELKIQSRIEGTPLDAVFQNLTHFYWQSHLDLPSFFSTKAYCFPFKLLRDTMPPQTTVVLPWVSFPFEKAEVDTVYCPQLSAFEECSGKVSQINGESNKGVKLEVLLLKRAPIEVVVSRCVRAPALSGSKQPSKDALNALCIETADAFFKVMDTMEAQLTQWSSLGHSILGTVDYKLCTDRPLETRTDNSCANVWAAALRQPIDRVTEALRRAVKRNQPENESYLKKYAKHNNKFKREFDALNSKKKRFGTRKLLESGDWRLLPKAAKLHVLELFYGDANYKRWPLLFS